MPFDPESMNDPGYDWLLKTVVIEPFPVVVITCAEPSALFVCVPIPKIIDPDATSEPVSGSAGRLIRTPLLSPENIQTGFCSCRATVCVVGTQPEDGHEK